MRYDEDGRQDSRGYEKGDSFQQRRHGGSKGKGNSRRSAPVGSASAFTHKASHEVANPSEEELSRSVKEAEAEEIAQGANLCRLRQEFNQAQDARDRAKRSEAHVRETAEDSQRRSERNIECLRNEIADLMKQVADHEKSQNDQESKEKGLQAELDAMILSQASAMARRDELSAGLPRMEEQARTSETLATKEEAKVKYLENKLRKEKERLDVVRAQADSLRREADDELAIKDKVQQEILRCQEDGDLGLSVWRHLAAALGSAVVVATTFRAF